MIRHTGSRFILGMSVSKVSAGRQDQGWQAWGSRPAGRRVPAAEPAAGFKKQPSGSSACDFELCPKFRFCRQGLSGEKCLAGGPWCPVAPWPRGARARAPQYAFSWWFEILEPLLTNLTENASAGSSCRRPALSACRLGRPGGSSAPRRSPSEETTHSFQLLQRCRAARSQGEAPARRPEGAWYAGALRKRLRRHV